MNQKYSLSGLDVAVLFCGLLLLAALNVAQLMGAAEGEPKAVDAVATAPADKMSGEMKWAYERWDRKDQAVAVFARGDTAFGWVEGYLDEAVARTDALAWCARHATDCDVIEVRAELVAMEGVAQPVNARLVPIIARVNNKPGPVALAVAGTGAFAVGRGDTAGAAADEARTRCADFAAKDRPAFLPVHPCTVILRR